MHTVKYRSLFILLLLCSQFISKTGRTQFQEIYRGTDANNSVNGISFINASTGYLAFSKFIGFTQDGGKTILKRYITYANTDFNGYTVGLTFGFMPQGVVAFSTDSLIAFGHFSLEPSILFSSNGGQNWKLVYHLPSNFTAPVYTDGITEIEFPGNGRTGYALHHEEILKTTDRGQTWSRIYSSPNGLLRKLSCPTPNKIYASGGNKVYASSNGGTNWIDVAPTASSTNPHFNNIFFLNDNTGYCTENTSSQIFKTTNAAQTWTKMNDETIIPVRGDDLWFTNDSIGFLATNLYEVWKTIDNGKTWEICKKDKPFQYQFYSLNSLFFLNDQLGWAGGDGEYLLSTTDGGSKTIPSAYFKIDMSNVSSTNAVYLINYSKQGYSYSWYKNGTLISTNYHAAYSHTTSVLRDSITLIVSNGIDADTTFRYADFSAPMTITSFSPEVGYQNRAITIRGTGFFEITGVSFGGVPAKYFQQRGATEIYAEVGSGATGDVKITNPTTSASKGGFVFLIEPRIDLQVAVEDAILCKAESATISVANSEADVMYEFKDESGKSFGGSRGNGGELHFATTPINTSGTYYVWASRNYLTTSLKRKLPQPIQLTVEHTKSVFNADKINVVPGEAVNYKSFSSEASAYTWGFPTDASVSAAITASVSNISFTTAGPKTVTLESVSSNGCRDTLTQQTVTVYNKPATEDVCYANNTDDVDSYEIQGTLRDMTSYTQDGYLVCGHGTNPIIKSRYGTSKKISSPAVGHLASYTKDGILKWVNYIEEGYINAAVADNDGNIYLAGVCHSNAYFHFSNGDSMSFVPKNATTHPAYNKDNGFILKLDAKGQYVWHTLIFDPSKLFQGYAVQGGISVRMQLQGNRIVLVGSCLANLSYYRNGASTSLLALQNSVSPDELQNNYVLNIDTSGKLNWFSYIHNTSVNQLRQLTDISIDAAANVYITGLYEATAEIHDASNNSVLLQGATAATSSYILKYDAQGHLLWNIHSSDNELRINACIIDPSGFLYVTGRSYCLNSSQHFLFNNANGTSMQASFGGYFFAKIHPEGRVLWSQGVQHSYYGEGSAIFYDGTNILTAGTAYNNDESFSTFVITSANNNTQSVPIYESEFFLAKYDTNGNLLDIRTSGRNAGGHVNVTRLLGDSKKNILLGGYTDNGNGGVSEFDIFNNTISTNSQDAFYAKLNLTSCGPINIAFPNAGSDTTICAGQSVVIGNLNPEGYSYTWASDRFSASDRVITVTPVSTTAYYVSLQNPSGTITRDTVIVTVSVPLANAGADKVVCKGASVVIGSTASSDRHSWTSIPSGFTSQVANPEVLATTNTLFILEVHNNAGCIAKDTVSVTVNELPDKPVIIDGLDNQLESSSPAGNQWYFDTIAVIPNAIRNRLSAAVNTWYSVRVTQNGCTSQFSERYQLNSNIVAGGGNIVISPNPAHEAVKVNFIIPSVNRVQAEIYDNRGMLVCVKRNVISGGMIPISNLAAGLYIVRITGDSGRISTITKFIKY